MLSAGPTASGMSREEIDGNCVCSCVFFGRVFGGSVTGAHHVPFVFVEQHDGFCELSQKRARRLGEKCALRRKRKSALRQPSDPESHQNLVRISPFLSLQDPLANPATLELTGLCVAAVFRVSPRRC